MTKFMPEGYLLETGENKLITRSPLSIADAYSKGEIIEARASMCDADHNLIVNIGGIKGIIPRNEGAIGIEEGFVRDIAIISRVGKPVCFVITGIKKDESGNPVAMLSRRIAQKECIEKYIKTLNVGDIIDATVTHLEPFGAFCDIGCGISSLLPIDSISVSRISHPKDRFSPGDKIKAVIKSIDGDKITLSQKELLGTWTENASLFSVGETVSGIIRSVESYGIFVELTPNLAGLAEPKENAKVGDIASVYIKSILPEKMKVKLIVIDSFSSNEKNINSRYFIEKGHIDSWVYSPLCATKRIESAFNE